MRRSFICLAAILLAGWVVMRSTENGLRRVVAEDPPSGQKQSARSFEVPQGNEAVVLADFVKVLQSLRPADGPQRDEYNEKAPAAIRQACERILELERDATSQTRQFAERELLFFRMKDLSEENPAEEKDRQKIASEAVRILKSSERTSANAQLAISLGTLFEEFASVDEAKALYQSLSQLYVGHSNDQVAHQGLMLAGAARRLDCVGNPFELTGTDVEGSPFDIESLKGSVVLVNFWASWCEHCRAEFTGLKRDYEKFHDGGFEIVGVSLDDDQNDLATCLKESKLPWKTLHDEEKGSEHPAATHYGITAYPTSFLLDREGRVLAVDLKGKDLGRKLAELLAPSNNKASYPKFNAREIITELTTAGTKLKKAGKAKDDEELRKGLHRKTVELKLPEPLEEEISDREVYRRACESIFLVCSMYHVEDSDDEWETSLATAFAVTADGVLSTSAHVFDNDDNAAIVIVMDVHKNVYAVQELLAVNREADTCLFRIAARETKPLTLARDAAPGTRVRVVSHPGDSLYYLSTGVLANYESDGEDRTWLNVTADFGQGSSGGPVMDECGNVVGQVSRTYTLYAGGAATRGQPRRVQNDRPADAELAEKKPRAMDDLADPQMVFKSCVPVAVVRSLVKGRVR